MFLRQQTSSLRFFRTTPPLRCPYLPDQFEVKLVTELALGDAGRDLERLSDAGFRRSHQFVYKPLCPSCQACVPVRIPVDRFTPGRGQRRNLMANADVKAAVVPAAVTGEQFTLFARYLQARHADGDMADMDFDDYRSMVEDSPVDTRLVEFRLKVSNELVGACLTDWMSNGISAVYSFFDPRHARRGLGTFMILWLVQEAARQGLPFVYLGYWIAGSRKMAYKTRFRPLEALAPNGRWEPLQIAPTPGRAGA